MADPPTGQQFAQPPAQASAQPPLGPGSGGGGTGQQTSWTATTALPKAGASGRRRAIVLAVVLAVAVAGVSTYLLVRRTGAATANAAIHGFADDVEDGRLLDAAGLLHPSEAELVADLNQVLSRELTRLDVIRPGFDLNHGSESIKVSGLRFDDAQAEQVRDNVVIHKLVAGRITLDPDTAKTPLSDHFQRLAFPDGIPTAAPGVIDIADIVSRHQEPIRIATVHVNGRWYVSAAYTGADYSLREEKRSWAGSPIPARGADTAENAVRQSIQALMDQDYRRLVELAPPSELQVVHDTGEAIVAENPRRGSRTTRLLDLRTEASTVNGNAALTITRLSWEDQWSSGSRRQTTISKEGGCFVYTEEGRTTRQYCGDKLSSMFLGRPRGGGSGPLITAAAANLKVTVINDGGQYYVSPAKTVVQIYGEALRALQPSDIDEIATAIRGR